MDILIGRAEREEIGQMLGLLEELFSLEQDFSFDADRARRGLDALLDEPERATVLVARQNNRRLIGMCTAQLVLSTAQGGYSAWVEDVVVAATHRGRGVGARLLHALEHWCRERGAHRMQLVADRDNLHALRFYARESWSDTNLYVLKKLCS